MLIDTERLKLLVPVNQLQYEHRHQLADQAHIVELQAGDELSSNEEHRWFIYLLDGKVDLVGINHQPTLVQAGDARAYHPLFNEDKHRSRLIAQSGCRLVRFEKHLFHLFLDDELFSAEELETVEMGEVEGVVFNEIVHAFNTGELKLPSLPDIAIKVKKAVSSPHTSAQDVARIVSADPTIATRLINAANGPLNRGVETITGIQAAVVRLGLQVSRNLVISFCIQQLFRTKSKILTQRMHDLYDHSTQVAAVSFALCKLSGKLSPDHVLLAGLLHQIGVVPILGYIEETGLEVENDELDHMLKHMQSAVGSMVIRQWGLPADLLAVVEDYANWQRNTAGEVDACDMIIIANIYNQLRHHKVKGLPRLEQVAAFKKLFPGKQDEDFVEQVFAQAQDEIASVMGLLNG